MFFISAIYRTAFFFSTPAPGYYNDDAIPDFLIKYAHGPGFPLYYHSDVRNYVVVIDSRN